MPSYRSLFCLLIGIVFYSQASLAQPAPTIIHYIANPAKQNIALYWKDEKGAPLLSLQHLRDYTARQHKKLVFAMNGGMYMADHAPVGLFIQNGKRMARLNTRTGRGNFYLQPNGIFYLTQDCKAIVCKTQDFVQGKNITYATQSGPMLVTDNVINPLFTPGSANLNIRNGVGILPDGRVVMAMSSAPVNFYDFALFFKKLGCRNALYLDGAVSRMYLPAQGVRQLDGDFGVMVGVVE